MSSWTFWQNTEDSYQGFSDIVGGVRIKALDTLTVLSSLFFPLESISRWPCPTVVTAVAIDLQQWRRFCLWRTRKDRRAVTWTRFFKHHTRWLSFHMMSRSLQMILWQKAQFHSLLQHRRWNVYYLLLYRSSDGYGLVSIYLFSNITCGNVLYVEMYYMLYITMYN